eukprot:GFUD01061102.1.p1 GENE.GFUD01061102.1~~GFUD01061102.1.p1  ORF type:complete len:271 (+),score=71.44 GFUD01061102.1:39-851(+)
MATSLDCAAESIPGFKLGIQEFMLNPVGLTIETKLNLPESLKNKTKQEMKNESAEDKTTRNAFKKLKGNQETFYNKPTQKVYNMGGGQFQWDVTEAAEKFLERDYPALAKISEEDGQEGQTGVVMVPERWLSSIPAVVDMEDAEKRALLKVEDKRKMQGERHEKLVYEELSKYFENKEEEVAIIHSAYILEPDLEKRKEKSGYEKDFLVINKTLQYILNVEVKSSLSMSEQLGKPGKPNKPSTVTSAMNQIHGSKGRHSNKKRAQLGTFS